MPEGFERAILRAIREAALRNPSSASAGGIAFRGGEDLWLAMLPSIIGGALAKAGASGVVRYDGVENGVHVYSVFCRAPRGERSLLRLGFVRKREGVELVLAVAIRAA